MLMPSARRVSWHQQGSASPGCRGDAQLSVRLFGKDDYLSLDGVQVMIIYLTGVERLATYPRFEVQMLGGGSPRSPHQCNGLSCMHPFALLYQIAYVVAIGSLQSIGMAHDHKVSVSIVRTTQYHLPRKGSTYGVTCLGFDVGASVPSASSKGAYHLAARQGIAPFLPGIVGQVDRELVGVRKGIL